jgi:glycosyltransferase involved in cell wall biosynthesis
LGAKLYILNGSDRSVVRPRFRHSAHRTSHLSFSQRRSVRVAMLTYSFYESDGRVRRYAEALARLGNSVDVISLRNERQSKYNELSGVKVYRIQKRLRDEKGKFSYLIRIMKFFLLSAKQIAQTHLKQPYDLIHVHSVPDFEVFAAFVPKMLGAKVILDIHDPVPDFFMSKFGYTEDSFFYKSLRLIEKYSCHYADHVITVTDYWRDVIRERAHLPSQKITTIVNYPDTETFDFKKVKKSNTKDEYFRVLYPGTFNRHCGLHIVLEAIAILRSAIPSIRFDIYGKGSEERNIRSLTTKLGLQQSVFFHEPVPIQEVPRLMVNSDIGVALLAGEHTYLRQALNVKLFEFLAMGLPAVATRVDSIKNYLGENVAMLSAPNDPQDVARCIRELYENSEKREQMRRAGLAFAAKNNWQTTHMHTYFRIIQKLLAN